MILKTLSLAIQKTLARIQYDGLIKRIIRTFRHAKERSDLDEVLKLSDLLISHGDSTLACFVGISFLNIDKNWYDPVTAAKYLEPVAEEGDTNAQWHLGMVHYLGLKDGVLDPVTGYYWVKKAADAGNRFALEFLRQRDEGFEE